MSAEASSSAQVSAITKRSFRLRAGSTTPLWRGKTFVRAMTSEKPSLRFGVVVVEGFLMHLATQISQRPGRGDRTPAAQDLRASERLRSRRTPAPEDRALSRRECRYAFKAEVTPPVGCPHCGHHQAWEASGGGDRRPD